MGVCRICLEHNSETSVTVDEDVINALDKIIPPLNTALKRICTVCETCSENIICASHFIETANKTENGIRNEKKISNLEVIDLRIFRFEKPSFTGDVSICRICLKFIRYPRIFLYNNNTNIMHHSIIRKMMKDCYIILKYELTRNPVMCTECWTTLQSLYTFKKTYMEIRAKVSLFCRLQNYPLRNINEDTLEVVREFFDADLEDPPLSKKKGGLRPNKLWFTRSDDMLLLSLYYEVSNLGQESPKQCMKEILAKWARLRPGKPPLIRIIAKKLKGMLNCNNKVSYHMKQKLKAEVRSKLNHDMGAINGLKQECVTESDDDRFTDEVVSGNVAAFNSADVKLEPSSDIEEEFLDFIEPKIEMESDCESSSNSLPELERMDLPLEFPSPAIEQPSLLPEAPLTTPLFTINQPPYNLENFLSSTKLFYKLPNIIDEARRGIDQNASRSNTSPSDTNLAPASETSTAYVRDGGRFSTEPPPSKAKKMNAVKPPMMTRDSKKQILLGADQQPGNAEPALLTPEQPSTMKKKAHWPVLQLKPVDSTRITRSKSTKMLRNSNKLLLKSSPSVAKDSSPTMKLRPRKAMDTEPPVLTCESGASSTHTEPPVLTCEGASSTAGKEWNIHSVEEKRDVLVTLMNDHNYYTTNTNPSRRSKRERQGIIEKKRHRCRICMFMDIKRSKIAYHMKKEHQVVLHPLECSRCDYSAPDRGTYMKHSNQAHSQDLAIYKCSNCDYISDNKPLFSKHMDERHDVVAFPYRCSECDFMSPTAFVLARHMNMNHFDDAMVRNCRQCLFVRSSNKTLIQHIQVDHKAKPKNHNDQSSSMNSETAMQVQMACRRSYQCVQCSYIAAHVASVKHHALLRHTRVKLDDEKIMCLFRHCDFSLFSREEYDEHMRLAHNDMYFYMTNQPENAVDVNNQLEQETTDKRYKWEKSKCFMYGKLNPREKVPHVPVAIGYECEDCDDSADDSPIIDKSSILNHSSVKTLSYYCSKCEFFTKSKYMYKQHMINYQKENANKQLYMCDQCSFQTYSVNGLKIHNKNQHKGTTAIDI